MKKAVFFDFDGTIADSSEGIMECALKTVQPLGYDISKYSKDYLRLLRKKASSMISMKVAEHSMVLRST